MSQPPHVPPQQPYQTPPPQQPSPAPVMRTPKQKQQGLSGPNTADGNNTRAEAERAATDAAVFHFGEEDERLGTTRPTRPHAARNLLGDLSRAPSSLAQAYIAASGGAAARSGSSPHQN
jgi:hypothetical protein